MGKLWTLGNALGIDLLDGLYLCEALERAEFDWWPASVDLRFRDISLIPPDLVVLVVEPTDVYVAVPKGVLQG